MCELLLSYELTADGMDGGGQVHLAVQHTGGQQLEFPPAPTSSCTPGKGIVWFIMLGLKT